MIKIKRKIDMVAGNPPAVINLKQYSDDVIFEFELFASDGIFTVEPGTTVKIRGTKPDGEGYSADATLSSSTDQDTGAVTYFVTHNADKQMTAAAGRCPFELCLMYDDKEVNTANFVMAVARAALDMDTPHSNSVLREFVNVNDNYQEIVDAAQIATGAKETAVSAASDAINAKETAVSAAESAGSSAGNASRAMQDVADARDSAMYDINERARQIVQLTTSAEMVAMDAAQRVNGIENDMQAFIARLETVEQWREQQEIDEELYVSNGYVENEIAHFFNKAGDLRFSITGIGGGSGGGGGGAVITTQMALDNISGFRSKSFAKGQPCDLTLTWSSTDNGISTGPGIMQLSIGGKIVASQDIQQGEFTVHVADYQEELKIGTNSVTVRVTDADGNAREKVFTLTLREYSISSNFDSSIPYSGPFTLAVTPVGGGQKTIFAEVDGNIAAQSTTSVTGRQINMMIPAQTHGAHTLRIWLEATVNGETITSSDIYYEFIYIEPLNNDPIIVSNFNKKTVQQWSTAAIPFTVYSPNSITSEVRIYGNNELLTTITADRTEQSYPYRFETPGEFTFRIAAGTMSKSIQVTVTAADIDVEAETENLLLNLNAIGRGNGEEHPETWTFTQANGTIIESTLTGFNWENDGWGTDLDGNQRLRFKGDARGTIGIRPFESDPRPGGLTISIDFATRDVIDYTAPIISCMDDGKGFIITPESADIYSDQSHMGTPFKEDEHLRVDFVISKRANGRLLKIYTDGVQCGTAVYPDNDIFVQTTPVNISIGSNLCTVDIYNIRIYDNDLSGDQIIDNWISDTQDGSLMLERYTRNNIYDETGKITASKLPADLPYMIIRCDELPQFKGDKKEATLTFIDPMHPARSFISRVQIDVQGTSSQYYPRKNYKVKAKEGFTSISTGATTSKYAMNEDAIPAKVFTYKADFASSESANNTVLAMLYNDTTPYRTPAQQENEKVRQGIQGFPMVIFWDDGEEQIFVGKYNFNDDKSSEEVFGFTDGDECWELLNNTSNRVLGKSDDFDTITVDEKGNAIYAWQLDFEARYPDTDPAYVESTQLHAFLSWLKSTDTAAATGNALPEPVTYPTIITEHIQNVDPETGAISYIEVKTQSTVTFTTDSAEYRLAKFKNEAEKYIELVSLHYDADFKEVFIGMDNLAKNNMFAFVGEQVNEESEGEG